MYVRIKRVDIKSYDKCACSNKQEVILANRHTHARIHSHNTHTLIQLLTNTNAHSEGKNTAAENDAICFAKN